MANKIRRTLARALSMDEGEKRALIERILPRGEGGKRALRLESDADRQTALLAIAAALSADAITGEEAEELKRQAGNAPKPAQRNWPWWYENPPPGFECLTPDERERLGYVWPKDTPHPLEAALRAWRETARPYGTKPTDPAVAGDRLASDRSHCGAAQERAALDNINENASGEAQRGAEVSSA
jgi:hypothetical protein